MNVLTTLMKADSGTARVAGHDVAANTKEVRAVTGAATSGLFTWICGPSAVFAVLIG